MNNFWLLYRKRRELIKRLDTLLSQKQVDKAAVDHTKVEIAKVAVRLGKWLNG